MADDSAPTAAPLSRPETPSSPALSVLVPATATGPAPAPVTAPHLVAPSVPTLPSHQPSTLSTPVAEPVVATEPAPVRSPQTWLKKLAILEFAVVFLLTAGVLARGLWARPHWLTVRSWAKLLPAVGLASVVLSACGVEQTGVAGIGVDESGQLIGYIQMCDRHIDGATLYTSNEAKVPSQRVNTFLGKWEARDAVTDFARWPLLDPSEGWTALQTYVAPEGTAVFRLYGWTTDNSSSASHVTFQLSDISGLSPGEVLHGSGDKQVSTESDFRRAACEDED